MNNLIKLNLRTQDLKTDNSYYFWKIKENIKKIEASKIGIIICDMWNEIYWSKAVTKRVKNLAININKFITTARNKGSLIIHSPSDLQNDFYNSSKAFLRANKIYEKVKKSINIPKEKAITEPELPFNITNKTIPLICDTNETKTPKTIEKKREHPNIVIDEKKDIMAVDGNIIYKIIKSMDIEQLIITGSATNICILDRSFGIKQWVKWGVNIALARNLTEVYYGVRHPPYLPYLPYEEGKQLIIGFIEKFWCPTISSEDFILSL